MKHLHETFTDEEFAFLTALKEHLGENWHDYLLNLVIAYISEINTDDKIEKALRIYEKYHTE